MRRTPLRSRLAHSSRGHFEFLAAGAAHNEILADYPVLEEADILAALEFAARQSDHIVLR